jgi:GPH family glycoside/pentoside/hexuronide:cation symporter
MGAIMSVSAIITFFSVKEPKHGQIDIPKENFFRTYLAVFKNRAYLIILFAYALNIVAINFLQGILVYYFKYVFNAEGLTTVAMIALLVIAMFCIPLSVPVSKRIGKRLTYQIGLGILGAVCLVIYFAPTRARHGIRHRDDGDSGHRTRARVRRALGDGSRPIEWDAIKTGNRKEGAYYGMWTFIAQCGQALSVGCRD